jgi:hypothetical protein
MGAVAIDIGHLSMAAARRRAQSRPMARGWRDWLAHSFSGYVTASFAPRHVRFWEWISALTPGVRPRSRVEVWPRGGAKSTTVELGCAFVGAQPDPPRHFVLYVCATQEQADNHVQAIAAMLEKVGVRRALNEYGSSKGWRRQQIRTSNGFNVMSFGLDSGMRGVKLEEFRPDLIVFDDIDGRHDTDAITKKKIDVLTETVLPAGSKDCAVLIVQNKIAEGSIVSQLCDGRADFLHDRIVTVEPAIRDLVYERVTGADGTPRYVVTGGTATWEGQSRELCGRQMTDWGVGAFLREAQHEVDQVEGGLWLKERDITPYRISPRDLPDLDRIVVGIDPNTTSGGNGDEAGIIVAGTSHRWRGSWWERTHAYVLADATVGGGPKRWSEAAVTAYHEWGADLLVAEANNGGEMVKITIETIDQAPAVKLVHASRNKRTRAEPIQKLSADGRVSHVGVFPQLEKQLCSWDPSAGMRSPDRLDAYVWVLTELMLGGAIGHLNEPTGRLADYLAGQ